MFFEYPDKIIGIFISKLISDFAHILFGPGEQVPGLQDYLLRNIGFERDAQGVMEFPREYRPRTTGHLR